LAQATLCTADLYVQEVSGSQPEQRYLLRTRELLYFWRRLAPMGQAVPVPCKPCRSECGPCAEIRTALIEEVEVPRADLLAFEETEILTAVVRKTKQVTLIQREGYSTVRVFEHAEVNARVVGEIPSHSQVELFIDEATGTRSFCKVRWQGIEGWVGVKNIKDKSSDKVLASKVDIAQQVPVLPLSKSGGPRQTKPDSKRALRVGEDDDFGLLDMSFNDTVPNEHALATETKSVYLVQKEGHPTVRVFEQPELGAAVVGEIPSQSEADWFVKEASDSASFYRVKWRHVEGWVVAQHVRDRSSSAAPTSRSAGSDEAPRPDRSVSPKRKFPGAGLHDEASSNPLMKSANAGAKKSRRASPSPSKMSDDSSFEAALRDVEKAGRASPPPARRSDSDAASSKSSLKSTSTGEEKTRRASPAPVTPRPGVEKPGRVSPAPTRRTDTPTRTSSKKSVCSSDDSSIQAVSKSPKALVKKAVRSALELKKAGYTLQELVQAECSAFELKELGYSALQLREAGYTLDELRRAEYSVLELKKARFTALELRKPHFTVQELKTANFNVVDLKESGCTAQELKEAGYALEVLKAAGYTFPQLIEAGWTYENFKTAGYTFPRLSKECTGDVLKVGGCAAWKLRREGYSSQQLKDAGYSLADMKIAGYTAGELKKMGHKCQEMKNAGFHVSELVKEFNAAELKDADPDHTVEELKDAGCSSWELKKAGYSIHEIKSSGFTAVELKEEGRFKAEDLTAAGYNAKDLKEAGYTLAEKFWCCKDEDLREAGYSQKQLLMEKHHMWHRQRQERREQKTPRKAGA